MRVENAISKIVNLLSLNSKRKLSEEERRVGLAAAREIIANWRETEPIALEFALQMRAVIALEDKLHPDATNCENYRGCHIRCHAPLLREHGVSQEVIEFLLAGRGCLAGNRECSLNPDNLPPLELDERALIAHSFVPPNE